MAKDYYFILGVSSDATQEQIKSAYRREAKRCHPDLSGEGSEPFLAIREAYEVLGDEGRREVYDAELAKDKERQYRAKEIKPEPLRRGRCPAEPLVPSRRSSGYRDASFEPSFQPPFGEPYRRRWNDPPDPFRPEPGRGMETIHVQVSLGREGALRGGRVRVLVPVRIPCPACGGWGGSSFFGCLYCSGSGTAVEEYPVDVAFPGGIVDGDTGSVSLSVAGLHDVALALHFRVRER
jgi:molecular chaperone DnaJ